MAFVKAAIIALAVSCTFISDLQAQSFRAVPEFSVLYHTSDDGSVAIGWLTDSAGLALLVDGQVVSLDLNNVPLTGDLRLSGDGAIVLGSENRCPLTGRCAQPFVYNWRAKQRTDLQLPNEIPAANQLRDQGKAISNDGSTVVMTLLLFTDVGNSYYTIRWVNGVQEIVRIVNTVTGTSPPPGFLWMSDASADGSVLAGYGSDDSLWPNHNRVSLLNSLTNVDQDLGFPGWANDISPDGTVVVGQSAFATVATTQWQPFLWKNDTVTLLGYADPAAAGVAPIPGTEALSVSRDGLTVLGTEQGRPPRRHIYSTLWTESRGMQKLTDELQIQFGLDLSDFDLDPTSTNRDEFLANYMSPNGALVGRGPHSVSGETQAWIANIPPILIVNSVGDGSDGAPADRMCSTGNVIVLEDQSEVPECTLRAAIETATELGGAIIGFNIEGSGVPIIAPLEKLPTITVPMKIDGTTQSGEVVHISGDGAEILDGLSVVGTDKVQILGLAITDFERWGLSLDGGTKHEVQRSSIGFLPGENGEIAANTVGGIVVKNGATDTTIGGESEEDENRVYGGVVVLGDATNGIRILRNEIAVDDENAGITRSPIDLADAGASCVPWVPTGEGPNGGMPPPRLLSITSSRVAGATLPGAKVVVYRTKGVLLGIGDELGRYWPAWVIPVGFGTADGKGAFSIGLDEPLAAGTYVTAAAIDTDGNTSELAQLMRPVIYVPGIGGSWLKNPNGDNIWIPINDPRLNANSFLEQMALSEQGANEFNLAVDGIVEFGGIAIYGAAIQSILVAGYSQNHEVSEKDLWRFPYDWRTSTADRATDLRDLVDRVINGTGVAKSCDLDIVTHSNGGLVSGVYVRRDSLHSRDNVHRLINVASPYLGASKAAAAHSIGYVFDVEKTLRFDVQWGRMIKMARNMTASYGLMPSRNYWEAAKPDATGHRHGFLFQDLYGKPLMTYDETLAFVIAKKVDENGYSLGLGRNEWMLEDQQSNVHKYVDDWSNWEGPPQVFRQVGAIFGSTVTGWFRGPQHLFDDEGSSVRREDDDTFFHWNWRDRQLPVFGIGDETVPLLSATLGADRSVSRKDFSGTDSPWIEPAQYYTCTHTGIIEHGCRDQLNGPIDALTAVQRMLHSGYKVVSGQSSASKSGIQRSNVPGAEVLYVTASGPVSVSVVDSAGNRIGPVSREDYRQIEYDIEGIGYWPGEYGAAVSVPTNRSYTLTIDAPVDGITARVYRMQIEDPDEVRRNVLFDDQQLDVGGSLRLNLTAGGTPDSVPLDIDADGDGSFEGTVEPVLTIDGTIGYPAIPSPVPGIVVAGATGEGTVSAELTLPDVGATGWTWTLSESTDWIEVSATSGTAPATITLELAADAESDSLNTATMMLTLNNGGYSLDIPVPVELRVGDVFVGTDDELDTLTDEFAISAIYPNPFDLSARFDLTLAESGDVRVEVFDVLGRHVESIYNGTLPAGRHAMQLDAAHLPAGIYLVRVAALGEVHTQAVTLVR